MQKRNGDLSVQCVFSKEGEDIRRMIHRSFRVFVRQNIQLRGHETASGVSPGASSS